MRIEATKWRTAFAILPVLAGDHWVWLELFEYRTGRLLGFLPILEFRTKGYK